MNSDELMSVAQSIVAADKGVLAADESGPTIKKRFDAVGVESTEENRRRYRELLFTTEGIESAIGGVILYDETLRQAGADGTPFATLLAGRGISPGIKVDQGAKALALYPGDKVTAGLDGLRERLAEYKQLGAQFAKWRAVIDIDERDIPSRYAVQANAHALARYAALCQEAGLVPIVEPEVLMDGAHDIERCEAVTSQVLQAVFAELDAHRVLLEGMLLKPNMVIAGMKCARQADARQVAEATLRCLRRHVPAAVPGIVFLSGGQSAEEATANLNEMNKMGPHPWQVSFSYGRALQAPVLAAWKGQESNAPAAQAALAKRCRLNRLARTGDYAPDLEALD
ncbi:class I fructose-bisphosphate aldolase [Massilia sp. R2A-15]|uniref:class I fructose-bisphosphate aldolase n=1 Tax=Massilia sp. R2A-15 TaxID=3064278 RepID=UPI002732C53D|nr:class I fructose-bisphosphate aldolase [Massilia sp. R2A-15]WLI90727.1 class I fructose-bisphosphate aldolase [Massilia sp. R2A-15]